MELILLQKVTNLGVLGDKVNVKPGYGRNYLVPQGKAVHDEAEGRAAKLEGASVTITANAATEGKLFGSVGPRDIADAFTAAGLPLEKSEVIMGEGALRNVGEYEIVVKLHADVQTTVKVVVQAEA